ncbi:cyclic nucleotide-binding domain-containing protein [Lutibacter sp.]|uniref:Crp/Fnr family transcriptional regulator n=1 Tax=Lutibacter sp. TaxID=1925666 RepID=UPI0025BB9330|nr:cyclic nucleotide-binding domain-containing protein [Lutibacter sp.]MCF6167123.1 cyclic nucleotide-binding domain-containing protein [Lutibacter sp.]
MNISKNKAYIENILTAPIGQYIEKEGAEILSLCVADELHFKADEFLYHKGDLTESFYLITKGRFALVQELKNGKLHFLHILQKGDLAGELSFIDDTPHIVSVIALNDASVYQFKKDCIKPLILSKPMFMFNFMRAIIKRVHHTVRAVNSKQKDLTDYISSGGKGRL